MSEQERLYQAFLRALAVVFGFPAFLCVFLPYSWMNAVHQGLGLGELPQDPIVGYLARSASALYAFLLALLWVLSYDLRRHRFVLCCLGAGSMVFGLVVLGIDVYEGMPLAWRLGEGPITIALGAALWALTYRIVPRSGWNADPR